MNWNEFCSKYKSGEIKVLIDRNLATKLMDINNLFVQHMRKERKRAHYLWMYISTFCLIAGFIIGIAWFFVEYINALIPIAMILFGLILAPIVQKSAVKFIVQEALENEHYFNMLQSMEKSSGIKIFHIETVRHNTSDADKDYVRIIVSYGTALELSGNAIVIDESKLPYTKQEIKDAIIEALTKPQTSQDKDMLKGAYLQLSTWQKNVGSDLEMLEQTPDVESIEAMAQSVINQNSSFDFMEQQRLEMETLKQELIDKNLW